MPIRPIGTHLNSTYPTLAQSKRILTTELVAERFRMDVSASNIANSHSVAKPGEEPYARRSVELAGGPNGVQVTRIHEDRTAFEKFHDPGNPYADQEGFVKRSNINAVKESVEMMGAGHAYELSLKGFNLLIEIEKASLEIGKL